MPDTAPITLQTVLVASPDLMASEVDGELVMMHVEKGSYYGLDPVAARIWESLKEPKSVDEVCTLMMQRYDVDEATCVAQALADPHVQRFLEGRPLRKQIYVRGKLLNLVV